MLIASPTPVTLSKPFPQNRAWWEKNSAGQIPEVGGAVAGMAAKTPAPITTPAPDVEWEEVHDYYESPRVIPDAAAAVSVSTGAVVSAGLSRSGSAKPSMSRNGSVNQPSVADKSLSRGGSSKPKLDEYEEVYDARLIDRNKSNGAAVGAVAGLAAGVGPARALGASQMIEQPPLDRSRSNKFSDLQQLFKETEQEAPLTQSPAPAPRKQPLTKEESRDQDKKPVAAAVTSAGVIAGAEADADADKKQKQEKVQESESEGKKEDRKGAKVVAVGLVAGFAGLGAAVATRKPTESEENNSSKEVTREKKVTREGSTKEITVGKDVTKEAPARKNSYKGKVSRENSSKKTQQTSRENSQREKVERDDRDQNKKGSATGAIITGTRETASREKEATREAPNREKKQVPRENSSKHTKQINPQGEKAERDNCYQFKKAAATRAVISATTEIASRGAGSRETVSGETATKQTASKEAAARDTVSRQMSSTVIATKPSKETATRDTVSRQTSSTVVPTKQTATRDTVSRQSSSSIVATKQRATRDTVSRQTSSVTKQTVTKATVSRQASSRETATRETTTRLPAQRQYSDRPTANCDQDPKAAGGALQTQKATGTRGTITAYNSMIMKSTVGRQAPTQSTNGDVAYNHHLVQGVNSSRYNESSRARFSNTALDKPFAAGAFRWVALGEYVNGPREGGLCVCKWFKTEEELAAEMGANKKEVYDTWNIVARQSSVGIPDTMRAPAAMGTRQDSGTLSTSQKGTMSQVTMNGGNAKGPLTNGAGAKGSFTAKGTEKPSVRVGTKQAPPGASQKGTQGVTPSSFEQVFFQLDLQAVDVAVRIISKFNGEGIVDRIVKINRPEIWVFDKSSKKRAGLKVLQEPYIEGFRKFNSNSGWVETDTKTLWPLVMQALSHYSYHITEGNQLLCDIQGGVYQDGIVLSDPVIMSREQLFGVTDLGPQGIENFFAHHNCNQFCRKGWRLPENIAKVVPAMPAIRGTTMMRPRPPPKQIPTLSQYNKMTMIRR